MFVGCFAYEPLDGQAQGLIQNLLGDIPLPGADLPATTRYPPLYRALAVAAAALGNSAVPTARAQWLASYLGGQLGVQLAGASDVERRARGALTERLFRNLTAAVKYQAGPFEAHYVALSPHLLTSVEDRVRKEMQVDFLVALLVTGKEHWRAYEDLLRTCVQDEDRLTSLRLADVLEQTEDKKLQEFLGKLLLLKLEQTPRNLPPKEVAALVREQLGAGDSGDAGAARTRPLDERRRQWMSGARAKLAATGDASSDVSQMAQQTVRLLHWTTLAGLLRKGPAAGAEFDALAGKPPEIEPSDAPPARSFGTATPQARTMSRTAELIRQLSRAGRADHRLAILQQISKLVTHTPHITPQEAQKIADYLLAPKPEAEHRQLPPLVSSLSAWPELCLAVADALEDLEQRDQQVHELVEALVHTAVPVDGGAAARPWREQLQRRLLGHVQGQLSGGRRGDRGRSQRGGPGGGDRLGALSPAGAATRFGAARSRRRRPGQRAAAGDD